MPNHSKPSHLDARQASLEISTLSLSGPEELISLEDDGVRRGYFAKLAKRVAVFVNSGGREDELARLLEEISGVGAMVAWKHGLPENAISGGIGERI